MMQQNSFLRIACLLVVTFALAACGGRQLEVQSIPKSEHPQERVNKLDSEIAMARNEKINVLAPTWFAEAESSLNEAKRLLDEGAELSKIFENIATGQAQLDRAREIAKVSKATLPEVIEARKLARKAGAAGLGKDYTDVEEEFLELTHAIEKENLGYAQRNQAKVAENFRQLEIRAIKVSTIGQVRNLLRAAEKQKTDKIAPASYKAAKNKFTEADSFITENPYRKEQMSALANEALFLARRHMEIAKESIKLQQMTPEQIALNMENVLYKTSSQLAAPDMRDQSFEQQLDNIMATIAAQQADRDFTTKKIKEQQLEITDLRQKTTSLAGQSQQQKERLTAQKQLDQMFSEVRGYFEPHEAEVYKRENQLIIRLKTIAFPVGKSVIMPQNYALLSKVQRAIRAFGEPDVIIGGHTDSTGPEPINEHLSQQRAEAVRQYLVANGILPFDKIISVGYGSMRPLASNSTEKGRAMNRRIDVTISPNLTTTR
ncbi:MAG: OmpA family protein [Desulfobacterales bacterium]|jgi:outer membrane protein OmpA-like peptidoglycan-associated protein